jgi:hypothetical protein
MWALWLTKWHCSKFSMSTSVSSAYPLHRLLRIHHHPSSGARTICKTVVDVQSGLSLTPHQETKKGNWEWVNARQRLAHSRPIKVMFYPRRPILKPYTSRDTSLSLLLLQTLNVVLPNNWLSHFYSIICTFNNTTIRALLSPWLLI